LPHPVSSPPIITSATSSIESQPSVAFRRFRAKPNNASSPGSAAAIISPLIPALSGFGLRLTRALKPPSVTTCTVVVP